ncbi:MAG: hypothetical protein J7M34_14640 [Anaerolineae bacterium]|nr:hypothetical protein [Anaerolineae bacterium]
MLGNLSPFALLLLGFIIGWVAEWVIDLWLRRQRTDARVAQLEEVVRDKDARLVEAQERARTAEARVEELEAELRERETVTAAPRFQESPDIASILEDVSLPPEVSVSEAEEGFAEETGEPKTFVATEQGDDLASIPGLGPAYARLLKESGVLTYEDLARLDEADLRALIRARPSWSGVDLSAWIAEARRRAGIEEVTPELTSESTQGQAPEPEPMPEPEETEQPSLPETEEPEAEETPAVGSEQERAAVIEEAREPEPEEEESSQPPSPESETRDDLTVIRGIGRTYAERLHAAGIHTFEALAALTPEQLRAIIKPKEWQNVDLASWIEQAGSLAARERSEHE